MINVEPSWGNTQIYYDKQTIKKGLKNQSADSAIKEIVKSVERNNKQVHLFIDVDGCIIESGLETAGNSKTLEQWALENKENIKILQNKIVRLKKNNVQVGLSTGRGLEFSKRLIDLVFTKESGVTLDTNIVEGGLIIFDSKNGNSYIAQNVNPESAQILRENREKIIGIASSLGGTLEEGKFLGISLNPPINEKGIRDTDDFKELLVKTLETKLVDKLNITNSSSAVDITPHGVDKLETLKHLINNDILIYIGDSKNDLTAMSKSTINLAPSNSHVDVVDFLKNNNQLNLIANKPGIEGVNKMLSLINAAYKIYKNK